MKIPSEKQSDARASANPFEHRVARAISACTRCRSRKSKCDGKLPACSACQKAKVECIGFDAISKQNVSRSYIHDLEQEVLALRNQLGLPLTGLNVAPAPSRSGTSTPYQNNSYTLNAFTSNNDGPSIKRESDPLMESSTDQGPSTGGHSQAETEGARALSALGAAGVIKIQPPGMRERDDERAEEMGRYVPPGSVSQVWDGYGGDIDPSLTSMGSGAGGSSLTGRRPGQAGISAGGAFSPSIDIYGQGTSGMRSTSSLPDTPFLGSSSLGGMGGSAGGNAPGGAAGVNLARMVVDAVMRVGPANGAPAPNRRESAGMISSGYGMGIGNRNVLGEGGGLYPTSRERRRSVDVDGRSSPNLASNNNAFGVEPPSSTPTGRKRPIDIPALPPPAAVDRLVQVYVDFVQIMLPILHMPTFREMLDRVRDRSSDVSEADIFFVLMVLALSTMALSRSLDPTAELRMSSEAFYLEAVKHTEAVFEENNSLIGLQAILLFCYYSLLNPTRGSIWFLVGLASRTAVDHGLHHETPQSHDLTPLELDMNRRLFYAVYNLDRLLCHALGRPPSIPDSFISVPAFSNLPDSAITNRGLLHCEPDPYKTVALNFIPLRELQSTVYSRLYSVRSVDPPSHEWFMTMFDRLKQWLQNSPEPRGTQSTEGYAVGFHNTVLLLFRPSPACPRPSQDALATCLSSSSYIIRIFKSLQRKNKINWYWLSSHYVFMAGITYLYGLWNINMLGDSTVAPSLMEAHMDIQACLSVLEALSVTVPSARACRWTFEMLSSAILRRLSGEQAFNETSSSSTRGENSHLMPDGPGLGIGAAGARAESAMRHSFQSQGFPSPLPKLELPTEISLLDNLFLNPMIPHPRASDSTAVGNTFLHTPHDTGSPRRRSESPRPYEYNGPNEDSLRTRGGEDVATPRSIIAGSPAVPNMIHAGLGGGDGDLAASGFDFLSFLAADDGGQGANAVWEQTEQFRQEMPMLG